MTGAESPRTTTPRTSRCTSPTASARSPPRSGVREIHPGDVMYIEPGERHWHGVTPDRVMAHVAIQEADENGQVVTWRGHIADAQYGSR